MHRRFSPTTIPAAKPVLITVWQSTLIASLFNSVVFDCIQDLTYETVGDQENIDTSHVCISIRHLVLTLV